MVNSNELKAILDFTFLDRESFIRKHCDAINELVEEQDNIQPISKELERQLKNLVRTHGVHEVIAAFQRAVESLSPSSVQKLSETEENSLLTRERWRARASRFEKPPAFIRRVYGDLIGKGLTQAHLRRTDKDLYQALVNWQQKNELPADLDLHNRRAETERNITDFGIIEPATPEAAKAMHAVALRALRRFGLHY